MHHFDTSTFFILSSDQSQESSPLCTRMDSFIHSIKKRCTNPTAQIHAPSVFGIPYKDFRITFSLCSILTEKALSIS